MIWKLPVLSWSEISVNSDCAYTIESTCGRFLARILAMIAAVWFTSACTCPSKAVRIREITDLVSWVFRGFRYIATTLLYAASSELGP